MMVGGFGRAVTTLKQARLTSRRHVGRADLHGSSSGDSAARLRFSLNLLDFRVLRTMKRVASDSRARGLPKTQLLLPKQVPVPLDSRHGPRNSHGDGQGGGSPAIREAGERPSLVAQGLVADGYVDENGSKSKTLRVYSGAVAFSRLRKLICYRFRRLAVRFRNGRRGGTRTPNPRFWRPVL
jgi:hypothetical protein